MNVPESIPQRVEYQPSPAQLERANALRRFNRLYIYLPVGFVAIVVVAITILLLYLALAQADAQALVTLSAVADSIIIIYAVPTMVLCGIFPTLFIIAVAQGKQRGMAPIQSIRLLLWRVDSYVLRGQSKVNETAPKVARPLINLHARFAYIRAFFTRIRRIFFRS